MMNNEQYVTNVLTEQAELNLKYGRIFTSLTQQTTNSKTTCERKLYNQSETKRIFEKKKRHVIKLNEQAETSPNKNTIKFKPQVNLPLRNCQNLPLSSSEAMNREYFTGGRQQKSWKLSEEERKVWKQED